VAPDPPIRVAVVAADLLTRFGIGAMLSDRGFQVVAQLDPADLAAGAPELTGADVMVLDLGWQGLADWPARGALPAVPTLILVEGGPERVPTPRGARGILGRDVGEAALVAAVAAVAAGLRVSQPGTDEDWEAGTPAPQPREDLTPREVEVLILVADGLANKEIARRLGISENTVKFHLNAVLGKLGAHSRTEAAMLGARLGLVPM
jgi:DNA-binding NarL/FixJ family response regulator